ncbi:MAG TPA: tetratricopeptide repeat protein [Sedimentisphaerales bacterium]|nr:tetratricopeptide repeat protein [Sedimentisphaerales bacterium]
MLRRSRPVQVTAATRRQGRDEVALQPIQLSVCSISNSRPLSLSLEGTVLVCRDLRGRRGPELQIPVELITITENRRFKAQRLILSLLILLLSLLTSVVPTMILGPVQEREPSVWDVAAGVVLLGGFLAFGSLLVSFFFKVKTVCLTIAPEGSRIEFWRHRRSGQALDTLLEQIRQRQEAAENVIDSPAKGPALYVDPPSLTRQFFAFLMLSCVPSVMTGQPRFFLLAIFPVVWYLVRQAQFLRQPLAFRRAVRCFHRKDWGRASELLAGLLAEQPDHLPSYALLVYVYTRSGRFDDALEVIARYGDAWPEISEDLHTATWRCKRVGKRRGTNEPPVNSDGPGMQGDVCE